MKVAERNGRTQSVRGHRENEYLRVIYRADLVKEREMRTLDLIPDFLI